MAMLAGCGVETSQQAAAHGSEVGCDDGPFPAVAMRRLSTGSAASWSRAPGRGQEAPCLLDRVSWASTVALRDVR
jgi:hypothetical protein